MKKPSRSTNIGIATVKRTDVMNRQISYSSSQLPSRLPATDRSPLYMPLSAFTSQKCLIKEALDVMDTPPTTAKNIVTSRKSRGSLLMTPRQKPSLLTPRQTNELLRDDSDRLRAMLLYSRNFLHVEQDSDFESDIDE